MNVIESVKESENIHAKKSWIKEETHSFTSHNYVND
jgi:hypothetical protein